MKAQTIRFPDELLKRLKDTHAATFAQHRKSFNAWVVDGIAVWNCRMTEGPKGE